jgi:hypothetical protein
MRSMPTILLLLSFPAGAIGYVVSSQIFASLGLPEPAQTFVVLFAPLLIAGLVMVPFLVPFFDRKAKEDLAAYRRRQESEVKSDDEADE